MVTALHLPRRVINTDGIDWNRCSDPVWHEPDVARPDGARDRGASQINICNKPFPQQFCWAANHASFPVQVSLSSLGVLSVLAAQGTWLSDPARDACSSPRGPTRHSTLRSFHS